MSRKKDNDVMVKIAIIHSNEYWSDYSDCSERMSTEISEWTETTLEKAKILEKHLRTICKNDYSNYQHVIYYNDTKATLTMIEEAIKLAEDAEEKK